MRIGLRVLLGYFLIVALAALLVGRVFVEQGGDVVEQGEEAGRGHDRGEVGSEWSFACETPL